MTEIEILNAKLDKFGRIRVKKQLAMKAKIADAVERQAKKELITQTELIETALKEYFAKRGIGI